MAGDLAAVSAASDGSEGASEVGKQWCLRSLLREALLTSTKPVPLWAGRFVLGLSGWREHCHRRNQRFGTGIGWADSSGATGVVGQLTGLL